MENLKRYIEIDGQQIPVTEEVYRAYKRPAWAEHKRKERAKLCRDENGSRCTRNCRECPKLRDGNDLSLEKFTDDGFEIADAVDIAELIADKLLLEQLLAALDDEEMTLIEALYFNQRTERDYASDAGVSHQAIGKRRKKVIDKLRKLAWINEV